MVFSRKTLRFGAIGLGAGFQFLATIYVARVAGIGGFGEYILQLAAMQFLVSFSVGGGLLYWFRERAKIVPDTRRHRLLATVSYGIALLFALVGATVFAWESGVAAGGPETLIYLPLYLMVHLAHIAYAEARFARPAVETTAILMWFVGRQGALILLFFLYDSNGWSFPLLLFNMMSYWIMLPFMVSLPHRLAVDWYEARAAVKEWWKVNTTTVSSQLFTTLDVYAVRIILGEAVVGIYSYVTRLLRPQLLLQKSLAQYFNRPLAQRAAVGEFNGSRALVRLIGLFSGSGSVLIGLGIVAYLLGFDPEIHNYAAETTGFAVVAAVVLVIYLANVLNCTFGPNAMLMVMVELTQISTAINLLGFISFLVAMAALQAIIPFVSLAAPVALLLVKAEVNLLREWILYRQGRSHPA